MHKLKDHPGTRALFYENRLLAFMGLFLFYIPLFAIGFVWYDTEQRQTRQHQEAREARSGHHEIRTLKQAASRITAVNTTLPARQKAFLRHGKVIILPPTLIYGETNRNHCLTINPRLWDPRDYMVYFPPLENNIMLREPRLVPRGTHFLKTEGVFSSAHMLLWSDKISLESATISSL